MTTSVLMIVENRSAPGDPRVWSEAVALHNGGFTVSVISPRGTINNAAYVCHEGIHLYSYRLPQCANGLLAYLCEYTLSLFQTWLLSLRVLCAHGFDIIHVANPPDIFFLLHWFYRLLGKRFVFDQHDLAPELFKVKFGENHSILLKILCWLEKRSEEVADMVLTTNESQKEYAISRGGCKPEKVFVVRNGPALEDFSRVPADPTLKRGFPLLLIYVGGMEVQDGIEYALYVMYELIYIHKRCDVSLTLLGSGNALPTLKNLAHELHIDDYVNFTGWVDDKQTVIRYLSTADIGICPDHRNGLNEFSTTVKSMEYMALGLPIVSFDLKETRYTAAKAALYAMPNSSQDFAFKVVRLLENPELRRSMGQFARTRVEQDLSWDYSKQNLLLAYATLLPAPVASDSRPLTLPGKGITFLDSGA